MTDSVTLKDMDVIISLSDEEERKLVADMMRKSGAESIGLADNTLEMVLMALKKDCAILITEDNGSVLDLACSLGYMSEHSKYSTISVISDNWSEGMKDALLGSVDVFLGRPVTERSLLPAVIVDAARKKHMRDLEREYRESEESFAKDKNMSFAEHVIMDTLGLSKESSAEYINDLAEKYGYDEGEVSKIVYEVLLAGGKK